VDWVRFVPPGDVAALDTALASDDVAGVLIEPILGEGGVVPLGAEYLRSVRERCDAAGAVFAVDEVQTGSGRTGRWLALESAGVRADVVSLAKALGGGLPIGAVVARADVAFAPGEHGSTFGGGPVPSAGALAVLDTIRADDLLANVAAMGALLRDEVARLAPAGVVAEIRGDGLLCGLRVPNAAAVVQALLARGVLASTAGPDVVRCTPPFTIGPDEIDEGAKAVAAALEDVA
jgi:acetylornithine aminotransferase